MRTINVVISILFLLVSIGMVIVAYGDYHDAFADRRTYEMVHGISVEEYVTVDFNIAAVGVVGIVIGVLRFVDRRRERMWQRVILVLVVTGVLLFIIAKIKWAANGFDH